MPSFLLHPDAQHCGAIGPGRSLAAVPGDPTLKLPPGGPSTWCCRSPCPGRRTPAPSTRPCRRRPSSSTPPPTSRSSRPARRLSARHLRLPARPAPSLRHRPGLRHAGLSLGRPRRDRRRRGVAAGGVARPRHRPRHAGPRLDEAIAVCSRLWTEEPHPGHRRRRGGRHRAHLTEAGRLDQPFEVTSANAPVRRRGGLAAAGVDRLIVSPWRRSAEVLDPIAAFSARFIGAPSGR